MHEKPHRSDAGDLLTSGTFALRRALDDLGHRVRPASAAGRIPAEASGDGPAPVEAARGGQAVACAVTGGRGLS